MSKMMVKRDGLWTPMSNLKGDTGPLPADNSVTNDALVTDGAKTNTAYLMGNRLTATAEGEMVSVDDSYPSAALSLTVDGKSTQLTTTGKNLLDPNLAHWKTYSLDGASRKGFLIAVTEGYYRYHNDTPLDMQYGWVDDADDVSSTYVKGEGVTQHLTAGNQIVADGTHPYLLFFTYTTTSQANMNNRHPFLERSETFTSYEAYTGGKPSPNPDYPQEIESVIDPFFNVSANNFLNATEWVENAFINDRGSIISSEDAHYTPAFSPVNKVAYTLVMPRLSAGQSVVRLHGYDKNKKWVKQIYTVSLNPGTTTYSANITIPEGVSFVRISTTKGETAYLLRLRSVAVDYESYSGNYTQLQDVTLRSLPDGTKDELYLTYLRPSSRAGWAWYSRELVQRVRVMTLDGSETWGKDRFGFYHRMDNLATAASDYSKSLLCDCLAAYRQYPELAGKAGMSGYRLSATGANWLYINVEGISTISDFQAWLAERVPAILHETTEQPVTTQLDPIELPIMQAGTTNIWTDPSTSLSVTYERDRNIVISKLEAAAADLATS